MMMIVGFMRRRRQERSVTQIGHKRGSSHGNPPIALGIIRTHIFQFATVMSGFASLLHQFKQTTQEIGAPPVSGNSISSKPLARSLYVSPSTPVKRIFIACPPIETGGPEALHQLCHVINSGGYPYANEEREDNSREVIAVDEFGREKKIGGTSDVKKHSVKAYMLYLKERNGTIAVAERSHRPAKYLHYDSPMAMDAPGKSGCSSGRDGYSSDLVVWPEIWTKYIDALQPDTTDQPYYGNNTYDKEKPKKYQIAIWWLSVDNNRGAFGPKDFRNRCDVLHLVQSYYARQYVTSNLIGNSSLQASGRAKVLDLTEFIPYANSNRTSLSERTEKGNMSQDVSIRPLDVVYNPAKGMHYTDEIIRRGTKKRAKIGTTAVAKSSIHFHPIGGGEGGKERISGEEVVALLKRAKVVSAIYPILHISPT